MMRDKKRRVGPSRIEALERRALMAGDAADVLTGVRRMTGSLALGGDEQAFTVRLEADGWLAGGARVTPDEDGNGGSSGNSTFRVFVRGPDGETDGRSNVLSTWKYGARPAGADHGARLKAGTYAVVVKRTGEPRPETDDPSRSSSRWPTTPARRSPSRARRASSRAPGRSRHTSASSAARWRTRRTSTTSTSRHPRRRRSGPPDWRRRVARSACRSTSIPTGTTRRTPSDTLVVVKRAGSADLTVPTLVPEGERVRGRRRRGAAGGLLVRVDGVGVVSGGRDTNRPQVGPR